MLGEPPGGTLGNSFCAQPEYIEAFHAIARDAGFDSLDAWLQKQGLSREKPIRAAEVEFCSANSSPKWAL